MNINGEDRHHLLESEAEKKKGANSNHMSPNPTKYTYINLIMSPLGSRIGTEMLSNNLPNSHKHTCIHYRLCDCDTAMES